MFIAENPHRYLGAVVANGHCVRYVQTVAAVPHTSQWKPGRKVRGGNVTPGTAIATFGPDGKYTNRVDGSAHAAILIAETQDGLVVLDQWQGQPVQQRTIRWRVGNGPAVNDGDAFHVIETA